jgi:hypothetical protein
MYLVQIMSQSDGAWVDVSDDDCDSNTGKRSSSSKGSKFFRNFTEFIMLFYNILSFLIQLNVGYMKL